MPSPYASFNGINFDWGQNQPQRQRKNGLDTYSGSIILYSDADFAAFWALRAIVNVTPIGDGSQNVYIDSWADPASIQHALSMNNGGETHTAILSDMSLDQRYWRGVAAAVQPNPDVPTIVAIAAKVEFLLLT